MRTIKFRLWDKQEKTMIYENMSMRYYIGVGSGEVIEHQSYGDLVESNLVTEEYEIMQYAGLRDKNNKEIYERDVIVMSGGYAEIVFDYGCFKYSWISKPWDRIRGKETIFNANMCVVVGNTCEGQRYEYVDRRDAANNEYLIWLQENGIIIKEVRDVYFKDENGDIKVEKRMVNKMNSTPEDYEKYISNINNR